MIDLTSKFGRKAQRHLRQEYVVWLTTISADLSPQPRPVWFIWDGASFLIFSQPHAHKVRHITAHPQVALHFNTDATGDKDVIIFVGTAAIDANVPPAHKVRAYLKISDRHHSTRDDAGTVQPRILYRHSRDTDDAARLVSDRRRARLPAESPPSPPCPQSAKIFEGRANLSEESSSWIDFVK